MCVTGQFTEELARASPNSELEIRDWILWSALAPAQRVVNGQFDTKYHLSVGAGRVWRTITRPGSLPSLDDELEHTSPRGCRHCYIGTCHQDLGLATGHWSGRVNAGTSCQDSSGVWSIPKYELNYRMNFSWAWPCTTLSLSLSIRSSQSTNNISLSANDRVKIICICQDNYCELLCCTHPCEYYCNRCVHYL